MITDDIRSKRPLILIVEDSRTQAAMLKNILQQNGYEARIAVDGREALEVASLYHPDLVIADIVMPMMDGYAMCAAFKNDATLQEIPVILLTSLGDAADIVCGLQSGADYYLTKPYDKQFLLQTVATIFRQHNSNEIETGGFEIEFEGRPYRINAGRRQMLNLLLSTYSNAVIQNRALLAAQNELRTLNARIMAQSQQIEAQGRELQEINGRLRMQATRDSLTGLRNVRAFQERLKEEIDRAQRHHTPLSLLLLDVDHFKQFNDSFGHPAGDEVLREVSVLMEKSARTSDFVARYGGEEFVVLLPNTNADHAHHSGERLRMAIESYPWSRRSITVSIGIATTDKNLLEGAALLAQADMALYESKSKGRNSVSHARELTSKVSS